MNRIRNGRVVAVLLLMLQAFALARGAAAQPVVAACACCHTDVAHCHCGMHAHDKRSDSSSTRAHLRTGCHLPQPALTMLLYAGLIAPRTAQLAQLETEIASSDPPGPEAPASRRARPPPRTSI